MAAAAAYPIEARVALRGFGPGQVSQAVVFPLGVIVIAMMGVGCCCVRRGPSSQQN